MGKAIVTMTLGDSVFQRWKDICEENWRDYGLKHDIDIVVLDRALDESPRAKSRSPAWQKCLILEHAEVLHYERVAWFDADIFFNVEDAPDIFGDCPSDKVGGVNSFADPTPWENRLALDRFRDLMDRRPEGSSLLRYETPEDIYRAFGDPVRPVSLMLNTGVLVLSPKRHRDIMRRVYDAYEDRGASLYYENVPLSYELVANDLVHLLDPRFNHLWSWSKLLHYPFLMGVGRTLKDKLLRHAAHAMGNDYEARLKTVCATTALLNCYCLHFAGLAQEMEWVDFSLVRQRIDYNLGAR